MRIWGSRMTNLAGSKLYGCYRGFVPALICMVALLAAPSFAHAGVWEEFERRCLVPMENMQNPVTDGLLLRIGDGTPDPVSMYEAPDGGFVLSLRRESFLRELTCMIFDFPEANHVSVDASFKRWAETKISQNLYEWTLTSMMGAVLYTSTDWRESEISVLMHRSQDFAQMSLQVTGSP